jgi:hypothetical protein
MIKLNKLLIETKSVMNLARLIDTFNRNHKNGLYTDNIELTNILKRMDINNVNSKFIFSLDSLFPRNSFKPDYIRSGKAEQIAKSLYIDPKKPLQQLAILKDFILYLDNDIGHKNWYL